MFTMISKTSDPNPLPLFPTMRLACHAACEVMAVLPTTITSQAPSGMPIYPVILMHPSSTAERRFRKNEKNLRKHGRRTKWRWAGR